MKLIIFLPYILLLVTEVFCQQDANTAYIYQRFNHPNEFIKKELNSQIEKLKENTYTYVYSDTSILGYDLDYLDAVFKTKMNQRPSGNASIVYQKDDSEFLQIFIVSMNSNKSACSTCNRIKSFYKKDWLDDFTSFMRCYVKDNCVYLYTLSGRDSDTLLDKIKI